MFEERANDKKDLNAFEPKRPRRPLSTRLGGVKQSFKTIQYFLQIFLFTALLMVSFRFNAKVIFGLMLGVPVLMALSMGTRKAYIFLLYFIFVTFSIGQRTIYLGYYRIAPCAALMLILGVIVFFISEMGSNYRVKVPKAVHYLAVFALWGVFVGWYRLSVHSERTYEFAFGVSFFLATQMMLAIPAYYIIRKLVSETKQIQDLMMIMSTVCLFLSMLSICEYLNLPIVHYFSGYLDYAVFTGDDQFVRAHSSFWGTSLLSGFLVMWVPLIYAEWRNSRSFVHSCIQILSFSFSVVAIYISGHRGVWVPALGAMVVYYFMQGAKGVALGMIALMLVVHFAPTKAKTRIQTLSGETEDSSAIKRKERLKVAWQQVKENPISGCGWNESGLVHSDVLQVWVATGIGGWLSFTAIFFIVLRSLWRGIRRAKVKYVRQYYCGFIASVVGQFLILLVQPYLNLPEMYAPFWMLMALAFYYPNIELQERNTQLQSIQVFDGETKDEK